MGVLHLLLGLHLSSDFAGDVLTEGKARLEENVANLRNEYDDYAMVEKVILTDSRSIEIQVLCDVIRDRIDPVSFEDKQ